MSLDLPPNQYYKLKDGEEASHGDRVKRRNRWVSGPFLIVNMLFMDSFCVYHIERAFCERSWGCNSSFFFILIFFSFQVILRVEVFVRVLIVTDSFIEFIDT